MILSIIKQIIKDNDVIFISLSGTHLRFVILNYICYIIRNHICYIIRKTVFNMYICLNTVDDIKTNELKSMMENQDIKGSVFKNFDGIYI